MINNNTQISFGKKYCYIPKCKAVCCSNVPLPTRVIQYQSQDKIIRPVIMTIPAPDYNPYCRNAVIPVTGDISKYIFKIGTTKDGKRIFELDTNALLAAKDNYCPFLTEYGRCNIYEYRPPVCRDFGKKGWFDCQEKITLKELIKEKSKNFIKGLKEVLLTKKK